MIGDLGHAKSAAEMSRESRLSKFGTESYLAPEIVNECTSYNTKIDIWSFGCVLYEMLKLKQLFKGIKNFGTTELIKQYENTKLDVSDMQPVFAQLLKG